jgi:hypothetical protein
MRDPRRIGILWRKSSHSGGQSNCVEAARVDDRVLLRDSKRPGDGSLALDKGQWRKLVEFAKSL